MPDRDELPFEGRIYKTYKDSDPHWPEKPKAPANAPNVILIVLDDVGFSDLGCYGSEIRTPHIDALAAGGLRYNNFHVTSMCSPTRACLLSGRNAHSVGVGIIAEWANGFPGYQGRISKKAATLPEILSDHAYGSYATGKWHLTNLADYGAAGPHGDWPLGRGFSRWYGFHGALIDQWNPELYEDNHPIHKQPSKDYHLSADLIDHAISHIRDHVTSAPTRPFFEYLALGACHWPHQVLDEYIRRYRGAYDMGWDVVRAERFERQKKLGIVPASAKMAARNPGVDAWDQVPADMKQLGCRLQETYAAFLEHTDAEIGRLVEYLASIGQLDNTVIALVSDNGASAEGGPTGAFNMRNHLTHEQEKVSGTLSKLDQIGSEFSFSHYPMGWAQVSNTPLKWYKKDTHGGGVRAPLILHWPERIRNKGEIRTQFHHVIDVVPTLLDCIRAEAPTVCRGIQQLPLHGTSMQYTFDNPSEKTRKTTQYFELLGDRAVWHQGWKAVARHAKGDDYEIDHWELYDLEHDFTETNDLAAVHPEKLQKLIEIWSGEAEKFGVLPLDDREAERAQAFMKSNSMTRYEYLPGMSRIDRLMVPDISDRSYSITADLDALTDATQGVIFSWGSRFAGCVLYAKSGALTYEYIYTEDVSYKMSVPVPVGKAKVTLKFNRTGKNRGRISLAINGAEQQSIELPKTWWTYGTTSGLTCGLAGVPISAEFSPPFTFDGTIKRVVVELQNDGSDTSVDMYRTVLQEE